MKKLNLIHYFALSALLICTACKKNDDDTIKDCYEPITTIIYTLTPNSGEAPTVLTYKDLDGEGGDEPNISKGILKANQTYSGSLEILGESDSSIEYFSEEILVEDQEHQLFFAFTISGLQITYDDQDQNGNPLGIQSILSTENEGSGTLMITLIQEPDKFAEGVSEGEIENAGGEKLIEVSFPITIQ